MRNGAGRRCGGCREGGQHREDGGGGPGRRGVCLAGGPGYARTAGSSRRRAQQPARHAGQHLRLAIGRVEGTGRVVQRLGRRRGTAREGECQDGCEGDANVSHGPSVPGAVMAVQGAASPNEKGPPRRTARKSGRKASPSAHMVEKRLTVPGSHTNHTISCSVDICPARG